MVEDLVRSVEARLLIIDPIVAAIVTELDAHKDQHVRAVLALLAELAEEADCAVAIVGRLNKAPTTDAYLRVANSVAFWNASRSVVLVTEDGEGDSRLVAQRKANYARLCPVERHRVEEVHSLTGSTRTRANGS
jgi:DNA repair protein RadA/Sms